MLTVDRSGSDFMVDVIKTLGFEYVASNPGSSFRGIHESLINYGGNKNPEFITCCHEESSVALAQGYAMVEGKPMLVLAHSTVGLQHASMGIYNAWAGRAPILLMIGNTLDAAERRPGVEWYHSAQDAAAMVREYTKWDDTPISLPHFAESTVRAYRIAMTPPREPVVIVIDSALQEAPIANNASLRIPKLTLDAPPQGDSGSVMEAAKLLVAAQNPVVVAGHVIHSEQGMRDLVAFAEALQAPVIDQGGNLPSRHPLVQLRGPCAHRGRGCNPRSRAGRFLGLGSLLPRPAPSQFANSHPRKCQADQHQLARSLHQEQLPGFRALPGSRYRHGCGPGGHPSCLTEAIKQLTTDDRKRAFQDRAAKITAANQKAVERARVDATYGWDASPISTARLSAEVWNAVKGEG